MFVTSRNFVVLCDKMNVRRHEINSPGGKRLLRRQSDVISCERICCLVVDTQAGLERQADKIIFASREFFDCIPGRCCALDVLCAPSDFLLSDKFLCYAVYSK
jgi:hypothetical protein